MRFSIGAKATILAATAALALSACAADSEAGASASASASAESAPNVGTIVADINTLTGCETFGGVWSGGKLAGADVVAGYQYTCDVDGDGVAETTLSIYNATDDLEADLANVEAANADAAVLRGDHYLVATTDSSHIASLENEGVEVLRELASA
ncbi:hypothetical protein [Demequina silvatica]|uniref:hypothetical protein n=1 Tax=Demequina silvatica TaxID=1638988 RepID=UPI0007835B2D|nr:hypothetical protein [Demequina silvatica]